MSHEELMQQLAGETTDRIVRNTNLTNEFSINEIIKNYGAEIYKMGYRHGVKDCSEKEPPPMSQDATVGGGTFRIF